MANFNKVILAGNLTRDPELRYTPKGTAIAKLSIAINRRWRDPATNDEREEVTFVDVDAFGKQAETIGQYLKKGRPILVEGRLRLDTWEDKQTQQKKSKLGVVLESFQFLDSGNRGEGGGGGESAPRPRPAAAAKPAAEESDAAAPEDDDVPF